MKNYPLLKLNGKSFNMRKTLAQFNFNRIPKSKRNLFVKKKKNLMNKSIS